MNIIAFLLVGLVVGWIASTLVEGHGLGTLGDIVVGIIGAFVGGFLMSLFGLIAYGSWGALVSSVLGAVVFLLAIRMFRGTHSSNRPLRGH